MERAMVPDIESVNCQIHPKNKLSHFCCAMSCLAPLCVKCIKEHISTHKVWQTYPEIDLLEELQESCLIKLSNAISHFSASYNGLEQLLQNPLSEDEEGLIKIRKAKEMVITTVEEFFRELEERYISFNTEGIKSQSPKLAEQLDTNGKILQRMDKLYNDLKGKESFIEAVKLVIRHNFDKEYEDFQNAATNELSSVDTNPFVVRLNISEIDNLRRELNRVISIHQLAFQNKQSLISQTLAKFNSQWSTQNEITAPHSIHQSMQATLDSQSLVRNGISQNVKKPEPKVVASNKPSNKDIYDPLVIEKDYFFEGLTNKYLHFFQQKSHFLYLLDLENAKSTGKYEFEFIELKTSFKIPRWHRSLTTPFGEIYLTGGVDVEIIDKKLNESYIYDFNNQTLIPIDPMVVKRSGHAMIYLNGYIYSIGGYSDENDFTNKCERYDIRQNTWIQIASLNLKANNPACCTYQNQCIYKFGGKLSDTELNKNVEKYDTLADRWTVVRFEAPSNSLDKLNSFNILSSLACIQINASQIMFFGGTHANYSIKSDECYVLCIEKDQLEDGSRVAQDKQAILRHKILQLKDSKLPVAEGFWNNQVIIDNKNLFCLQNIPNEKNESIVYLDRRRVISFDFQARWKVLA